MKPKQFNPEKVLRVIAETFARYGYEGTSLDTLTKKTGLGKQSLYNTFGDKKALVTKSLGCYGKQSDATKIIQCTERTGRQKIEEFFHSFLGEAADDNHPGCLITNLLLEKGGTDMDVWKAASSRWNETRLALQTVIEQGVKDKSIRKDIDADLASYSLITLLNGLRVTARATHDCAKLKRVVEANLEQIL